jgi:hypothetical protein
MRNLRPEIRRLMRMIAAARLHYGYRQVHIMLRRDN